MIDRLWKHWRSRYRDWLRYLIIIIIETKINLHQLGRCCCWERERERDLDVFFLLLYRKNKKTKRNEQSEKRDVFFFLLIFPHVYTLFATDKIHVNASFDNDNLIGFLFASSSTFFFLLPCSLVCFLYIFFSSIDITFNEKWYAIRNVLWVCFHTDLLFELIAVIRLISASLAAQQGDLKGKLIIKKFSLSSHPSIFKSCPFFPDFFKKLFLGQLIFHFAFSPLEKPKKISTVTLMLLMPWQFHVYFYLSIFHYCLCSMLEHMLLIKLLIGVLITKLIFSSFTCVLNMWLVEFKLTRTLDMGFSFSLFLWWLRRRWRKKL